MESEREKVIKDENGKGMGIKKTCGVAFS